MNCNFPRFQTWLRYNKILVLIVCVWIKVSGAKNSVFKKISIFFSSNLQCWACLNFVETLKVVSISHGALQLLHPFLSSTEDISKYKYRGQIQPWDKLQLSFCQKTGFHSSVRLFPRHVQWRLFALQCWTLGLYLPVSQKEEFHPIIHPCHSGVTPRANSQTFCCQWSSAVQVFRTLRLFLHLAEETNL